jgi:hypothetical protein
VAEAGPLPDALDRARHCDMRGRDWHVWWRRFALLAILALPVLGLVNVFGQRESSTTVRGALASVQIVAPSAVRAGIVFTTQIVVTPRAPITDCELYLGQGWFAGMTLNGVTPQPSDQSSDGPWQIWQFGDLGVGQRLRLWISWQTNPTTVGHHSQPVAVYDGERRLVTVHRSMMIYP